MNKLHLQQDDIVNSVEFDTKREEQSLDITRRVTSNNVGKFKLINYIKLIGIKVRTSNKNELNPQTAKIASCINQYFSQEVGKKIANRVNPGITFCAYTDYETDHTGEYSYFIGEAVSSIDSTPDDLDILIIPAQKYMKFTTETGLMPDVVIHCWQKIWQMTPESLGGIRTYSTDFEVYDERAIDPKNTIVDIYIGIN